MAGSAAMRRAAIAQAVAASADLDFGAVLDRRPALRSAMAALVVVVLAACLTASHAAATRTALTRLAFPLGTADWPQRTHLGLRQPVEPVAIVRGQPLEVEVIDTGDAPLPPDCRIHYRLTDAQGRTRVETEPMQLVGEVMLARRENVTAPLEFCFTGGDDRNMNWIEVQVIDPPEVVREPDAHGQPSRIHELARGEREATSTRPLLAGSRGADCRQGDQAAQAGEQAAVRRRPRIAAGDRRRRPDVPRGKTVVRCNGRSRRADRGEIHRLHVATGRCRRRRGRRQRTGSFACWPMPRPA